MPSRLVMGKFRAGKLHSGSKTGPVVTNPAQAAAIRASEAADERETGSADSKRGKKPRRKVGYLDE